MAVGFGLGGFQKEATQPLLAGVTEFGRAESAGCQRVGLTLGRRRHRQQCVLWMPDIAGTYLVTYLVNE